MQKWSDLMSNQTIEKAKTLAKKAQSARNSGLTIYTDRKSVV